MKFLKNNLLLIIILLVGFLLRIFAINMDPFLHPWDERFHALVAKNMMDNPIVPILRVNPITENYDKFAWCCNHIWVHKQPLFLWQMGLSMKLFGVAEWSMRLPSALMGTLLILILYRITILLTKQKFIALLSATLLACSNFHLQMISGYHGMDHNDVAHGFYTLASIWALCEFINSPKKSWIIWIGIFAGAAILNKWLTGLLVYLIWGVHILYNFITKKSPYHIKELMLSLVDCVIVFLPWQLYILHTFPELASYEYEFNRRHISEPLEGHGGPYTYYLDYLGILFGEGIYYLVPIGILISLGNKEIRTNLNIGFITAIGFVFFFFSIIVQTKVDTYLFFVLPLALIYISITIYYIINFIQNIKIRKAISYVFITLVTMLALKPDWFINYLSKENVERNNRIANANMYKSIKQHLPPNCRVVMNMNSFEDIDVMFYNDGITAYHWTLPPEDFAMFKEQKIPIAVFKNHGKYELPKHVLTYPYLHIIDMKLIDFE